MIGALLMYVATGIYVGILHSWHLRDMPLKWWQRAVEGVVAAIAWPFWIARLVSHLED